MHEFDMLMVGNKFIFTTLCHFPVLNVISCPLSNTQILFSGVTYKDNIITVSLQSVEKNAVSSWVEVLSSQPRSIQLLTKDGSVVSTLEHALNRHLKDVRKTTFKADKR